MQQRIGCWRIDDFTFLGLQNTKNHPGGWFFVAQKVVIIGFDGGLEDQRPPYKDAFRLF